MFKFISASALIATAFIGAARAGDSIEVLHWWTSGGEAKALSLLKTGLEEKGLTIIDTPVVGGGGDAAMTVLRTRLNAGNAPGMAQMQAFDILDWAREGVLANLDGPAQQGHWEALFPETLKRFSKYKGHWVAAPISIHSTNWLWVNKEAFDRAGGKEPKTFDDLIVMLDHFRGQGLTAIAAGGEPWQDATLFDSVVLSLGDEFYRKALIELDPEALRSDLMRQAFERMAILRSYVDGNFSGREWNLATSMVIKGTAGMQIMGDWAKGEFLAAGKLPNVDFVCLRFPGTEGAVSFLADQFVMFKSSDQLTPAQEKTVSVIESSDFQRSFSIVKGSTPARLDVQDDGYDDCGKKALSDLRDASNNERMFGSLAHGHAAPASVKNAIFDVVTRHFNGELTAAQAVEELVLSVEQAK